MAIAFQGFAIQENLSESKNDRAILNNLGEAPIGDDLTLLFNNNKNKSSMTVTESNVLGSVVQLPSNLAVFSNKTKITVGESNFYIKDSNGIDQFSLSTTVELDDTVTNPPTGEYTRSDTITFENITNFSVLRRNTDTNSVDNETQLGFVRSEGTESFFSDRNSKQILEGAEANIDFYNYRRQLAIRRNQNFLGNRLLIVNGVVTISDIDGVNNTGISNASPGLFIYNPNTGTGIRAFSSSDNPWTANGTNLEALTSKITIKNLNFLTDKIRLISKNGAILSESVLPPLPINSTNFTHKVPVIVNGETFYLCIKLES
jgi:hypothetical protein